MTYQQLIELAQEVTDLVREWESRMYPRECDEYADFVAAVREMVNDREPTPDDGP